MNLILAQKALCDLKKKALKFGDFCIPGMGKERTMS